jgi:KDO2-lipid IV(A) lauroyltransferase
MPPAGARLTLKHPIRDRLELALVKTAVFLVSRLSRRAVLGFARFMGFLSYHLCTTQTKVAMANLDLAFGETVTVTRKQELARASYQTFFRAIFDFAWFSFRSRSRLERWFVFDRSFDSYLGLSPVIVVTAHFGNWELLGQAGSLHGNPPVSVAAMFPNVLMNSYITQMRERNGMSISSREGALRALLKALRDGGRVALLMDQNTRLQEGGVFVRFFGKPVTMSPAASVLSVRTGAPIVPVFCLALPDGTYRGYTGPVLRPGEAGAEAELNQRIADVFESEIRNHPDQWLWMYRRWKYVPPAGAAEGFPFYAHPAVESKGRLP